MHDNVVPALKFLWKVKQNLSINTVDSQDTISSDVNKGLRKYKAENKNKDTVDKRVCWYSTFCQRVLSSEQNLCNL